MEDIVPKPLRVIKTNQSDSKHDIRSVPRSSYPSIPCRSSSLRLDWRQVSSNSTNSTTSSPPFSDNPGQIKIRKRSRAYTRSSTQGQGDARKFTGDSTSSDEADMQIFPETGCRSAPKSGNPIVSRFFSGWSFKSLSSTMRRLSSDQTNNPDNSQPVIASKTYENNAAEETPGQIVFPSPDFAVHENADILIPRTIPITGIDMNTAANPSIIGTGPDSIWATVNISAEVHSSEPLNPGWPAPLDIVIILDIVPHIHISMLRQIVVSSLAIVSSLAAIEDRFAIAYIDRDSADGFGLLLPLGMHSLESARIALDVFSLHQLTGQRPRKTELQKIIQQISRTIYLHDRPSLCHVFFVTASPSVQLSTSAMERGIGFHTISPHFRFPFNGPGIPPGWHIFYDINSYDADSKEAVLREKISTAIEHIRTGVEPGVATELKLSLVAGDRCQVQAVLEESRLDVLRPGERWVVPVQIRVPAASIRQPLQVTDGNTAYRNSHPAVDNVMTQLQELLTDYSHEDITQHVMSVRLEYRHTLLPAENIVHLESSCMVVRDVHEFGILSLAS